MDTTTHRMELTSRAFAVLRSVDAGRTEVTVSSEPDLFIDGLAFADQYTAHHLAHRGLIRAARLASVGSRVPAELTTAGRLALRAGSLAPAAA